MAKSLKPSAEERLAEVRKEAKRVLKEKEKARLERSGRTSRLRALRVAKEAADLEEAKKEEAKKASTKKKTTRKTAAKKVLA